MKTGRKPFNFSAFLAAFFILLSLWLVLSGHYDSFHVTLGVICCALIAFLSHDLLFPAFQWGTSVAIFVRFMAYLPWLFYQIVLANLHVAKMVLHPKMPIDPRIVEFDSKLESNIAFTTLANSITLTPGTVTIGLEGDELTVHALTRGSKEGLETGEMDRKVTAMAGSD